MQPLGELAEASRLAAIEIGAAFRVVAHEDLGEGGVERLDVGAEVVAVLEVELVETALLDRHRQDAPVGLGLAGDGLAELLVDENTRSVVRRAVRQGELESLEDQRLRVRNRAGLLSVGVAADAEHLLLE